MTDELFNLDGKVGLVTGGSRGIGVMIAQGLLTAGAKVYIASRKADELARAVTALSAYGPVEAISADLGKDNGIGALTEQLTARENKLHLLFNNAGTTWGAALPQFPGSAFDKVLSLNVKAAFLLTQALLPLLRAAALPDDPARVVNTGSVDGIRPPLRGMNNYSYSASKAGVHMLTRHLAADLAPSILVNAVAPGLFESKMTTTLLAGGADEIGNRLPLGRIGHSNDMAGIAVFLASRASSYITGAVIPVDGGISTLH